MKNPEFASVYRFNDKVAITIEGLPTFYIEPEGARKLSRALNSCARDCTIQQNFSKSLFKTTRIILRKA